jgi:hypothetical protein
MAPKKPENGATKSDAVREVLSQTPHVSVREAVNILAARGIKVQPSLVYALKSKARQKKRRQTRQRVAAVTGNGDPVALIVKVRGLAMEAGGFGKLKALVEVLAE